jgi:hypothetical protein
VVADVFCGYCLLLSRNHQCTNYKAIGSQGELVIVEGSHEAIQDYGEDAVQQKASEKYDAGLVSNNIVTVRTADFD